MEHLRHKKTRFLQHVISAPFIYSTFIWFVFLDIFVEIYHRICFPLYWLKLVDRSKYLKFDRKKLSYLKPIQKFNCMYCSYWNWLIMYVKEITAQTEIYWCGIRHAEDPNFIPPEHHKDFLVYDDEKAFYEKYGNKIKDCKLIKH